MRNYSIVGEHRLLTFAGNVEKPQGDPNQKGNEILGGFLGNIDRRTTKDLPGGVVDKLNPQERENFDIPIPDKKNPDAQGVQIPESKDSDGGGKKPEQPEDDADGKRGKGRKGGRGGRGGDININVEIGNGNTTTIGGAAPEMTKVPELSPEDADQRLVAVLFSEFQDKMRQRDRQQDQWNQQYQLLMAQGSSLQVQNVVSNQQKWQDNVRALQAKQPASPLALRDEFVPAARKTLLEKNSRYDVVTGGNALMPIFYEREEFVKAARYNKGIDAGKLPIAVTKEIERQRVILEKNPNLDMAKVVANMNRTIGKLPYHFEAPPQGWPFPLLKPGAAS